jgi:hypothetical protein
MLDEVFFVRAKSLPVLNVLSKIDFLSCPECGLLVLVHLPYVIVFNG